MLEIARSLTTSKIGCMHELHVVCVYDRWTIHMEYRNTLYTVEQKPVPRRVREVKIRNNLLIHLHAILPR